MPGLRSIAGRAYRAGRVLAYTRVLPRVADTRGGRDLVPNLVPVSAGLSAPNSTGATSKRRSSTQMDLVRQTFKTSAVV